MNATMTKLVKKATLATVKANHKVSHNTYRLCVESEKDLIEPQPGQFISILCSNLVVRRPFSVAFAQDNYFEIIYKVRGEGTKYIENLKEGQQVNYIGPLGSAFCIENKKSLFIGGGVGVGPMMFLAQRFKEQSIPYTFLAGFHSNIDIGLAGFPEAVLITDDGTSGKQGSIVDYIKEYIEKDKIEKIYTCGPDPVMQKAAKIAEELDLCIEVAIERFFACSVGVCMGCSIDTKDVDNPETLVKKRICKHGPVFDGRTIVWE